jgi:hypothetical protein
MKSWKYRIAKCIHDLLKIRISHGQTIDSPYKCFVVN